ncbi:MAG: hypothetical protein GXP25_09335 [Planctomycetes bacterium]|nr:hypothetical protein [Planctomycetota bacterium]
MAYLTAYLRKGLKLEPQFYWNLGDFAQEKIIKGEEGLIAQIGRGDDCDFQLAEPYVSWHQGEFHLLCLPSGRWAYVYFNASKYGSGYAHNLHELPGQAVNPEGRLLDNGIWIFFPYTGSKQGAMPKDRAFVRYTEEALEDIPKKLYADAKSFGDTVIQDVSSLRIKK